VIIGGFVDGLAGIQPLADGGDRDPAPAEEGTTKAERGVDDKTPLLVTASPGNPMTHERGVAAGRRR